MGFVPPRPSLPVDERYLYKGPVPAEWKEDRGATRKARPSFKPSARGSLVAIAGQPSKITKIVPESPRPAELLASVRAEEGALLNAIDIAVFDVILSWTYEIDKEMQERAYRIPLSALRRFCGQHTKSQEVVDAFNKLSKIKLTLGDETTARRYEGVPMIVSWKEATREEEFIGYQFPEPIREIMKDMKAYAHIELVPLCDKGMHSRHSAPLYKYLALQSATSKWVPGEENIVTVMITPEQLVDIIDFPRAADGSFNVGKLTKFVTAHAKDYEFVRRFKARGEPEKAKGRGQKIEAYKFTLSLMPPSFHNVFPRYGKSDIRYGGIDDPRYLCRSDIWIRAARAFGNGKKGSPFCGYLHNNFFNFWQVALHEALEEKQFTPRASTRQYRGENLLEIIEQDGADFAAWGLITEEMHEPDLISYIGVTPSMTTSRIIEDAETARRDRIQASGASKKEWQTSKRTKILDRNFSRYIDAEKAVSAGNTVVETTITAPVEDIDVASYFDAEPELGVISFDNCTTISLDLKPLPIEFLEGAVFTLLPYMGGGEIAVEVNYVDADTGEKDQYLAFIGRNFDTWTKTLAKLQPHMIGLEEYR